jgi:hypothetical protein
MNLSAFGITTVLPPGWEGRITRRAAPVARAHASVTAGGGAADPSPRTTAKGTPGEIPAPVVHLANFALPEQRGDFGSGAVDLMGRGHIFVCLFEYGPESVGQALFSHRGIPRLTPAHFRANGLQRSIRGQAGCQRWFTEAGRAFCLYTVLGAHSEATRLVPQVNGLLGATRIVAR